MFRIRQARIGKYLKADPHSMVEVMEYIKDKYGFAEVDRCSEEYREQYEQMRASFLMQYAPGLLGEYADVPQLTSRDEEGIRNFMEQLSIRQKRAESVSREVFDIDFHIFKKEQDSTRMDFVVESKYGYIGGGFCGSGKTKRWKDVVRTLARR